MSSAAVRNLFRTEFATLGTPFYDTINKAQKPNDQLWFTAEFYSDYMTDDCFSGKASVEHGTVDVVIFAPAGKGDAAVLNFADTVIQHFRVWKKNTLEVVGMIAPTEVVDGDAESRWYGIMVNLEYEYRF